MASSIFNIKNGVVASNTLYVTESKVGIGLSSPTYSLDIYNDGGKGGNVDTFRVKSKDAGSSIVDTITVNSVGLVALPNVPVASSFVDTEVLLINTSAGGTFGRLSRTGSSAFGGGGSGAGFPFSGNAVITGSLLISGSGLTVSGSVKIDGLGQLSPTYPITSSYPVWYNTSTDEIRYAPYVQYTALITQDGNATGDTSFDGTKVLINTTGDTIRFDRTGIGKYKVIADKNTFTANRTAITLTLGNNGGGGGEVPAICWTKWSTTKEILFFSYDLSSPAGPADSVFLNALLDIKIYQ